ncbi:MAG: chromate transporter [Chthonomonadales bacterium]|nr:chromate transporter [Chthonomonadales bacterium]
MNPLLYFWLFLKASLFSTGGFGNLPSLHHDLLARGWATESQFAESMMVGQISPGPNGLWVISLGYLTDGLRGTLFALLAVSLPPLLVLIVERIYRAVEGHPAVEGFMRGLTLAISGIFVVILLNLLHSAGMITPLWNSVNARPLTIAIAALLLGATKRVPFPLIILLGAVVGLLWR